MNATVGFLPRWTAPALLGLHLLLGLPSTALAQNLDEDPPARAARLTALQGDVGFRAVEDQDWQDARANRPLTSGDALDLAQGARAELSLGGGQMRLGGETRAVVDRLDDQVARLRLEQGRVNLRVDQDGPDPAYEIETATFSFIPTEPGEYRVDVEPDGTTRVVVYRGAGTVYGARGARYELRERQSYTFADPGLRDVAGGPIPERDSFDRWVDERDGRYARRPAREYVSEGVVGWDDLDDHGRWETVEEYGPVWYPRGVVRDWAPYRYGHWEYIRPWGWTWIDDAPWGYAPFHYGRWVHWHGRWGWVPGPRHVRPVYAPALVVFLGSPSFSIRLSSGPPVGWFPLGPREVYCPPYRTTRHYFTQVNVTNVTIKQTVVHNVYDDVHVHRHGIQTQRYAYRGHPGATTVVSREDFGRARHLGRSRLNLKQDELARADLSPSIDVPRARRDPPRERQPSWGRTNPAPRGPARAEADSPRIDAHREFGGARPGSRDEPSRFSRQPEQERAQPSRDARGGWRDDQAAPRSPRREAEVGGQTIPRGSEGRNDSADREWGRREREPASPRIDPPREESRDSRAQRLQPTRPTEREPRAERAERVQRVERPEGAPAREERAPRAAREAWGPSRESMRESPRFERREPVAPRYEAQSPPERPERAPRYERREPAAMREPMSAPRPEPRQSPPSRQERPAPSSPSADRGERHGRGSWQSAE